MHLTAAEAGNSLRSSPSRESLVFWALTASLLWCLTQQEERIQCAFSARRSALSWNTCVCDLCCCSECSIVWSWCKRHLLTWVDASWMCYRFGQVWNSVSLCCHILCRKNLALVPFLFLLASWRWGLFAWELDSLILLDLCGMAVADVWKEWPARDCWSPGLTCLFRKGHFCALMFLLWGIYLQRDVQNIWMWHFTRRISYIFLNCMGSVALSPSKLSCLFSCFCSLQKSLCVDFRQAPVIVCFGSIFIYAVLNYTCLISLEFLLVSLKCRWET